MLTFLSTIGERLKWLRTKNDISQDEMARIMWVSRMTYIQTENDARSPRSDELQRISADFEIPLSSLTDTRVSTTEAIVSTPETDPNYKFKQTFLYILSRCGQKPNIGKTILNKLLYFADFNFYEKNGERSITNASYIKMPFGPVPSVMDGVISEMIQAEQIHTFKSVYQGYEQDRFAPLSTPDIACFSALEIQELDTVIGQFSDKTANWISDYSHEDLPYRATDKIGDTISYWLAFYRTPEYSVRPPEKYED